MIGLVYSVIDRAGRGIAGYLVNELRPTEVGHCREAVVCLSGENFMLAGFNEDVIYFDFLDKRLPPAVELYIILSRHSSEAGIKSYTVHATGNFSDDARVGGRPRELGIAHPPASWALLKALDKISRDADRREEYEVSYEATHHGPTNLLKPTVFIEIGSSLSEWSDSINHIIVGEAIKQIIEAYPKLPPCKPVIGVGGGHYPKKHTELALSENVCFGHIASKYALSFLDLNMLNNVLTKSAVAPEGVVVERKSTTRQHRALVEEFSRGRSLQLRYI
ncbi:MAG: D-aminoacyl-tRNA deacylase [Desulfurococcaceae archaeon]